MKYIKERNKFNENQVEPTSDPTVNSYIKKNITKELIEDMLVEIEDSIESNMDGNKIDIKFGITMGNEWIDFTETGEITPVERVGWIIDIYYNRYDITGVSEFNKYFVITEKIKSMANRIEKHFKYKSMIFDLSDQSIEGCRIIIEYKPTILDAVFISNNYLNSYDDELAQFDLIKIGVEGDGISFKSKLDYGKHDLKSFTKSLKEWSKDQYPLGWKSITEKDDRFIVHGLAVEDINFKF